jgi:hypothetical protein
MADSKTQGTPTWMGSYPILHEDHAPELDAAAAVHEFRGGMSRQDAEARAHEDYTKGKALEAAAHHLLGIRAAHAAGADEAATLHGQAYAAAMQHAGHDPLGTPPPEVLDRARELMPKAHAFKAHGADAMFAPAQEGADPEDTRIREMLGKMRELARRAREAADKEAKP